MSLAAFDPHAPDPHAPQTGAIRDWLATRLHALARRWALEISLFAGLALMLSSAYVVFALTPERPQPAPVPVAVWVDVSRPLPMFAFAAPEFSRQTSTYAMRRHSAGGGREDTITLGQFAESGPYMRLVVHQVGAEGAPAQTLFLESVRRAADAGLALDSIAAPSILQTRFGPVEIADAKIALPGAAKARQGCAVFRFSADQPALRVSGLACGAAGAAFAHRQMSCLVGGLDLTAASDDPDLQKFFARSELARDEVCSNPRARAAAAKPAPAPAAQATPAKPKIRTASER